MITFYILKDEPFQLDIQKEETQLILDSARNTPILTPNLGINSKQFFRPIYRIRILKFFYIL